MTDYDLQSEVRDLLGEAYEPHPSLRRFWTEVVEVMGNPQTAVFWMTAFTNGIMLAGLQPEWSEQYLEEVDRGEAEHDHCLAERHEFLDGIAVRFPFKDENAPPIP